MVRTPAVVVVHRDLSCRSCCFAFILLFFAKKTPHLQVFDISYSLNEPLDAARKRLCILAVRPFAFLLNLVYSRVVWWVCICTAVMWMVFNTVFFFMNITWRFLCYILLNQWSPCCFTSMVVFSKKAVVSCRKRLRCKSQISAPKTEKQTYAMPQDLVRPVTSAALVRV